MRKRTQTTTIRVLGLLAIGLVGVLLVQSPGGPAPLRDETGRRVLGSLSERVFVEISGVRQGMFVQSADLSNPVLLFLHGGPGMPEFDFTDSHPMPLARHFTVVWWKQRGAGLSFGPGIPPETMTLEQMIADAVAVADHRRPRFGKDRIYLLGHSWGSFPGIQVGLSDTYLRLRDAAMHGLGAGTTHDMRSGVTGNFLPVWRSHSYTLAEKVNIWRGPAFSRRHLWDRFLRTDLSSEVTPLGIPV